MRRHTSRYPTISFLTAGLAAVLGVLSVPHTGFGQGTGKVDQPVKAYNPYPPLPNSTPPTVLPPNLQSELLRVRAEVNTIEARYLRVLTNHR